MAITEHNLRRGEDRMTEEMSQEEWHTWLASHLKSKEQKHGYYLDPESGRQKMNKGDDEE